MAASATPEAGTVLLLDTHALLWWLQDNPRLSDNARRAIAEPTRRVMVSAASAWEMATKVRLGKFPEAQPLIAQFPMLLRKERFQELPISSAHALTAGQLPGPHRDPFDRMLMAQARVENAQIVSVDPIFADYGIAVVW